VQSVLTFQAKGVSMEASSSQCLLSRCGDYHLFHIAIYAQTQLAYPKTAGRSAQ
jgi:hypothetical protein